MDPHPPPDEDDAYAPRARAALDIWHVIGTVIGLLGAFIICFGGALRWGSIALIYLGFLGPEWEYPKDLLGFTAFPGAAINFLGVAIIVKSWHARRSKLTKARCPG
jgi:hypothetical protein